APQRPLARRDAVRAARERTRAPQRRSTDTRDMSTSTDDRTATFTVTLTPAETLPGAADRFDLSKTWTGALEGTSQGVMLTAGDPASGSASYIATELFEGTLDGREGTVTLQQLGTMAGGEPALSYVIAPGQGTGPLAGLTGTPPIGTTPFEGTLDGREGTVPRQQLGTMGGGEPELSYVNAPGSGTGALAGLTGTLTIGTIHEDGRHDVAVELS